ncbi:MAG: hypothetical protein HOH33_10145 [Verrucomicrobia bacterium]|jgi:hypothetical protein|nr:hypothetical protein [Verrucomicrobiota bacterium]
MILQLELDKLGKLCVLGLIVFLVRVNGVVAADSPEGATNSEVAAILNATEIPDQIPTQPEVGIDQDAHLDKAPVRVTKGLDLVKDTWTYDCMSCHRILESKWKYDRKLYEHEHITLDHGNNRFCLNCHHPKNRNAFVDYDGTEILEENVVLLCAKCHGPTYQDWKAGAHGRTNGFWDKTKGKQTKLRCIQCHDPHSPKFALIESETAPTYPKRAAGSTRAHGHDGEEPGAGH